MTFNGYTAIAIIEVFLLVFGLGACYLAKHLPDEEPKQTSVEAKVM